MELNLLYVHGESIGYGRYGVELARSLQGLGVDVYDHLPHPADLHYEEPRAYGDEHLGGRRSKVCQTVCWVSVPTHATGWWKGQIPVISTMWEATRLPESFRETLHEFELVIVPSQQNVELFSQYHDNVKMVPLGVDPERWHYIPRTPPGTFFDFLISGSGPRKGTDLAHMAFRKLFGKPGSWPREMPIPRLVMKNPRGEQFHGERIEIVGGRISAEAEADLYARAHCYLQPSRGEGFGLQPLQAIAQGCPTILTDAHGHGSFAHLGYGLSTTFSQSAYFIYGDAGEWWEPSFDELCDYMQFVYHNYDVACDRAAASAKVVAETFTWENTARNFIEAIGHRNLKGSNVTTEWYTPTQRKFPIVTNKDWACDIAGYQYQFRKGHTYYEWADVKRILFEAELLDPVCLVGDDPGLAPSQLERLPEYSAQHAHCELCGQPLNSQPTKADELYDHCR